MSVRIEIELTSSNPDGSWTWRAAGARQPRGVLDGTILPSGSSVGDQLRVETEHDVDGIRVLSVVPPKEKAARSGRLELLPTDERFEPVVQHRAPGARSGEGARRPRRERDGDRRSREGGAGDNRGDRQRDRGERRDSSARRDDSERRDGPPRREAREPHEERRRPRPHFTPPPEVPQRPKPKRLRPGKQHRIEVLAATPEEQRPVAELALQGMAAVRQRLREDNARLKADGKPEMPEAAVLRMAEELLPRLRVADWLDRAEAAQRQLDHLDLRDLRSVVAASDDPLVARDESTRELAVALKSALATKQDEELALWLADVEAALDVGRVVRALRLSSQPPKAGVPFPGSLATRLAEATTASLQPTDGPDRWSAVLEAAAFSPIRTLVAPVEAPQSRSDELLATVKRLAPLLPQVAALFAIEVAPNAPTPKPLRPTPRRDAPKKQAARPPRPAADAKPQAAPAPAESQPSQPPEASEPETTEQAKRFETTEPVESAESAESAEGVEAAEQVEPTEQVEAAELAEPAELVERAERDESTERDERAELAEPTEGVEAAELAEPVGGSELRPPAATSGDAPVDATFEAGDAPGESAEPASQAEPSQPPEASEPEITEQVKRIEPAERVEPTNRIEPAELAEPAERVARGELAERAGGPELRPPAATPGDAPVDAVFEAGDAPEEPAEPASQAELSQPPEPAEAEQQAVPAKPPEAREQDHPVAASEAASVDAVDAREATEEPTD